MYEIAEVKATYKTAFTMPQRPKLTCSYEVSKIFRIFWGEDLNLYESVNLLLLNNSNKILGISKISHGTINSTQFDIFKVVQLALLSHSNTLIIAHNHPSGELKPSSADIALTKKLKEACKTLEIRLIDHLILTEFNYYSFADEGML